MHPQSARDQSNSPAFLPFLRTAVHAIISFWSYTLFFSLYIYIFIGISSCLGGASIQERKQRSENETETFIITYNYIEMVKSGPITVDS